MAFSENTSARRLRLILRKFEITVNKQLLVEEEVLSREFANSRLIEKTRHLDVIL